MVVNIAELFLALLFGNSLFAVASAQAYFVAIAEPNPFLRKLCV
jgi:hypothetical protein